MRLMKDVVNGKDYSLGEKPRVNVATNENLRCKADGNKNIKKDATGNEWK